MAVIALTSQERPLASSKKVCCCKTLGAVRRRVAERLEQAGMDKRRNIVWLAVEHPDRARRLAEASQAALFTPPRKH